MLSADDAEYPREYRTLGGGGSGGSGGRRFSNVGLVHTSERRHTVIAAQSLEALSGLQKVDADRKRDAFMDHLKSKYPQHALALRGQQDRMREQVSGSPAIGWGLGGRPVGGVEGLIQFSPAPRLIPIRRCSWGREGGMGVLDNCPGWPFLELGGGVGCGGGGGGGSASIPLPAILGFGARDWVEKVQPQKLRLLDGAEGQEGMSWRPREWWGGRGDTLGTDCSEPEGPSRRGVEMLGVCISGIWASGSLSRLDVMCSQLLREQSPELLGPFTAFSLLPLSKTCCVTLS